MRDEARIPESVPFCRSRLFQPEQRASHPGALTASQTAFLQCVLTTHAFPPATRTSGCLPDSQGLWKASIEAMHINNVRISSNTESFLRTLLPQSTLFQIQLPTTDIQLLSTPKCFMPSSNSQNNSTRHELFLYFSPDFVIPESVGEAQHKRPKTRTLDDCETGLLNGSRGKGGCSAGSFVSPISGADGWFLPSSALDCVLHQLQGMSQHLPPPGSHPTLHNLVDFR